jgi:hypothetical protein
MAGVANATQRGRTRDATSSLLGSCVMLRAKQGEKAYARWAVSWRGRVGAS